MVAVNSLLYVLLSAGLSSHPDQSQDVQSFDSSIGMDLAKLCPPKEHLSECEAHCQKNCTNFDKPFACPRMCIKGCVCDEGLVRAADGKCIQPKQCPGKDTCPRGEHYEQCSAHCQRNCTTWGKPLPCPRLCVHGCVCDRGTVRGPKGKCIKPDKCPKKFSSDLESEEEEEISGTFTCPDNEHFTRCDAYCQTNCSNHDQDIPCKKKKYCLWGCICDEGFTRGPDRKCIEIENCPEPESQSVSEPEVVCPRKEHFSECEAHCQKNCTNYNKPFACPRMCIKGCVCDEGLVRGQDGKCMQPKQCPGKSVCPKGEHYDQCNAHCQRNCTTWGKPLPCTLMCVHGCVCDLGTVRGPRGNCIKPDKCPRKSYSEQESEEQGVVVVVTEDEMECPANEHLSMCGAHCQKNCTNYEKPIPCPYMCIKGCVCDEGFVRGRDGKCVKPEQCPATDVCPRGEHYDQCGAHCQRNCTTLGKPLPCPFICVHGCVCDRGTIRGPKGECIRPNRCPKKSSSEDTEISSSEEEVFSHDDAPKKCPAKEHMSDCDANCQKKCSNYEEPIPCPKKCVKGCVCDKGLVRAADGKCVAPKTCPVVPKKCPAKEHMSDCDANCEKKCSNYKEPIPCPKKCVKGCVCDKGLVRAADGKCVAPTQCPDETKKCPLKEHFSDCEAHCQKNCTNYAKPFPCPQKCVQGCVCDKGLVRANDGKCVAAKQCPGKDVCPQGEHYDQCNAHCQRNCTTWGKPLYCPVKCVHGCVCDVGSVRGPKGKCIKPDKCPIKSFSEQGSEEQDAFEADFCPENEEYSRCKAHCQGNCRYKEKSCAGVCVSGCRCKEGYIRGPKGNCILPSECTSKEIPRELICPTNEHFDRCTAHCQKNCTTIDKMIPCMRICVPGCICDRGFIRGFDGKCILRNQCPPPNEISTSTEEIASSREDSTRMYEEISSQEEQEIRSQEEQEIRSQEEQEIRSQEEQEIRSQEEQEIRSQDEFEVQSCPVNEHYDMCNYQCQRNCSNWEREYVPCPKICAAGCVCDHGFVRGPDGSCIKPEKCSEESHSPLDPFRISIICRTNEVLVPCPCPLDCDNYETKKCYICIPGCQCKSGYVKGPDGTCIKKEECPREKKPEDCTELEFYDSCGSSCPDDCTNFNQQDRQCTKNCVVGCFCVPGFVRGPSGDCVFPFECPAKAPLYP